MPPLPGGHGGGGGGAIGGGPGGGGGGGGLGLCEGLALGRPASIGPWPIGPMGPIATIGGIGGNTKKPPAASAEAWLGEADH